jgi:hypothetical protein
VVPMRLKFEAGALERTRESGQTSANSAKNRPNI